MTRVVLEIVRAADVGDRPRAWCRGVDLDALRNTAPSWLHEQPSHTPEHTHAIVATTDEAPDPAERAFWEAAYCAALHDDENVADAGTTADDALTLWRKRWAK